MLRFLLIIGMTGLFVATIYRLLNKTTVRMKSEFDNEAEDTELRLAEIKQKMKKLDADCAEEKRSAVRKAKLSEKVRKSIWEK